MKSIDKQSEFKRESNLPSVPRNAFLDTFILDTLNKAGNSLHTEILKRYDDIHKPSSMVPDLALCQPYKNMRRTAETFTRMGSRTKCSSYVATPLTPPA